MGLEGGYSQTREKCSRPISSLRDLQGQKFFADAIIKILIPTKSISDKNWYDQLHNEVVKFFTFQFGKSVTKFYVVKVLLILMKFLWVLVKYHKKFFWWERKKNTSINFPGGRINWKMAIFGLQHIKVNSFYIPMKWTYKIFMNSQFKIQANCNDHKKFQKDLLIKSTSKLNWKNDFFAIFFGSHLIFEIHGCCSSISCICYVFFF